MKHLDRPCPCLQLQAQLLLECVAKEQGGHIGAGPLRITGSGSGAIGQLTRVIIEGETELLRENGAIDDRPAELH